MNLLRFKRISLIALFLTIAGLYYLWPYAETELAQWILIGLGTGAAGYALAGLSIADNSESERAEASADKNESLMADKEWLRNLDTSLIGSFAGLTIIASIVRLGWIPFIDGSGEPMLQVSATILGALLIHRYLYS